MEEKKDKLRRPRGHHLRRRRHKCLSLANLILFKGFDGLKTLERAFDFTMASRKFLTWRRTRWRHYGSTAHQPRPRFFLIIWPLLFHSPPLFQIIALPPSFASRGTAATAERERERSLLISARSPCHAPVGGPMLLLTHLTRFR